MISYIIDNNNDVMTETENRHKNNKYFMFSVLNILREKRHKKNLARLKNNTQTQYNFNHLFF